MIFARPTRVCYINDCLFFSYLPTINNTSSETGDPRRIHIDSDWLGEMVRLVEESKSKIDGIFNFLARYVRKVHSDEFIHKGLRLTLETSFLDVIGPNDIAYVIALVKNSWEMWDQDIRLYQSGSEIVDNP